MLSRYKDPVVHTSLACSAGIFFWLVSSRNDAQLVRWFKSSLQSM
ncbi:unnamed protein product [Amoebophrya sp. A25]|nr:unnamed protein product [Amoebophrya sp. A25]|eukprot:GSA25T00001713001.1